MPKKPREGCLPNRSFSFVSWLLLLAVVCASFFYRTHAIKTMSPTWDEPFYFFQGQSHAQTGVFFSPEVRSHPPLMEALIGLTSTFLNRLNVIAPITDIVSFTKDKIKFFSAHQYRIDYLSQTPQGLSADDSLIAVRFIFQFFTLLLAVNIFYLTYLLTENKKNSLTAGLCAFGFILLEPSLIGLSSLISNDIMSATLGFSAISLYLLANHRPLKTQLALLILSTIFISLSILTKVSFFLFIPILGMGIYYKKISSRFFLLIPLAVLLAKILNPIFGSNQYLINLTQSQSRLSYLDGIMSLSAQPTYFLQLLINKMSLTLFGLCIYCVWIGHKKNPKKTWTIFSLLILTAISYSLILPGIGFRLAIALFCICIALASTAIPNQKWAAIILASVTIESFFYQNQFLAYQNPLAGREPRSLDANRDWGQGLKAFIEYKEKNPALFAKQKIAISYFGTALPESYGLEDYTSLTSFAELLNPNKLTSGNFSGYVLLSENLKYGYPIKDQNLMLFQNNAFIEKIAHPIECFESVLCLYRIELQK